MDQELINAIKAFLKALDHAKYPLLKIRETQTYTTLSVVRDLIEKQEKAMPGPRFRPEGPFHMYDTWFQRYWILESHQEAMKETK